ncbi:MAG: anthranilate phosphoribosyltransferase [Fimbriimonadaceae bacterium]
MDLGEALSLAGRPQSRREAALLMGAIVSEDTPDDGVAAILTQLAQRPSSPEELAGYCDSLFERMVPISLGVGLVDTCGTGGGKPTPNVSTVAALIAGAAGARVAKHGNRAVTSAVGSADVLEALGVAASATPQAKAKMIEEAGVCFLFAPDHHPALRRVGPIRRSLGFRTIFNQLGPLLNPARARVQITGVFDPALQRPTSSALEMLGGERAAVVWHEDGYDEAMPFGRTRVLVTGQDAGDYEWGAGDFGVDSLDPAAIPAPATAEEAAVLALEALTEPGSVACRVCLPTTGLALWLSGLAETPASGVARALEAVASGKALASLEILRRLSHDS